MLSPIVPYSLLKMHWNPEHAQPLSQWPEQHLDVSSTTSSPAHKSELFSGRGRGSYNYAWANDDISALTASNLLKRYAEKYSGVLDSPYDRPPTVGAYPEPGGFGGLNSQKTELEPWPLTHNTDTSYPLVPPGSHEGLPSSKVVATSAVPPGVNSVSAVNSNLSDSAYSGSSSCSGSTEYPSSYNGTYLSSGFCPQPSTALPPASLHSLQSTATLVPSYSPNTQVYNYPPSPYPPQTSLAPSYSHSSTTFLPSGLPAPTPVSSRPTAVGGPYSYQTSNLVAAESIGTLKRKAFEMSIEEDDGGDRSRYRKYSYDPLKSGGTSPYSVNEKECRGNGFNSSGSTDPQTFKPSKPSSQPLVSPQFGAGGEYSPPAGITGENGVTEQDFTQQQQHHSQALKRPPVRTPTVETVKSPDPRLLELINGELLDRSPALLWSEVVGLTHVKAALEEDLIWPVLRPSPVVRPPRTVLLFGPRGGGKMTLTRSLASQLGASFYHVSGAILASKGKLETEHILGSLLQVAEVRQPSVVLLSQVEAMEEDGLRQILLNTLEKAQLGTTGLVIIICTTGRPDLLQDALHQSFAKRYFVGLPDVGIRQQVLLQALTPQGCSLSDRELNAVLQRAEGFSVWELLQLSQQALSSASSPTGALHGLATSPKPPDFTDFENAFCKVRPHTTTKELDNCIEWSKMYSH
uniref:ATPase AAA-type core domain-containing protein n=1 Tax=Nothobranchius rachovii TaxID=451742 RepID=A0A1A8RIB7_9TELE